MFNRIDRGIHLTPEQKETMLEQRRKKMIQEDEAKKELKDNANEEQHTK